MEENIYSLLNCPQVELLVATKKKARVFFFFVVVALLHFQSQDILHTHSSFLSGSCLHRHISFLSKPSSFARTTFGVIFLFFPLIVCAVQQEHVHVQSETVKFLLCGQMTRHVDCKNELRQKGKRIKALQQFMS